MKFDVRIDVDEEITEIVFAGATSNGETKVEQGFYLVPFKFSAENVAICDSTFGGSDGEGFVLVSSKEHAENLIKALQKAIKIGWLK